MIAAGPFLRPGLLPLLLAAPALWLLFRAFDRARRRRLEETVGPRAALLAPGAPRRRRSVATALFAAGLLLALVSLAEPTWGEASEGVEPRGADVVVCLDVSRSMLARDVAPSRLERARAEIRALAAAARGDRVGLVVFAGEARLLVPLTRDLDCVAAVAATADPLSVGRGGSDLGAALDAARAALDAAEGEARAIVLVTDGEDLGARGRRAAERCAAAGIAVHAVALGSPLGSRVPVEGPRGEEFLKDAAGREVLTATDPEALRRVAAAGGGAFVDGNAGDSPLATLHRDRIAPAAARLLAATPGGGREPRASWALVAALALFLVGPWLTTPARS